MNAEQFARLAMLGWDGFFDSYYQPSDGLMPARVVGEERGFFKLQPDPEAMLLGVLSGSLRHSATDRADLPAIGDWVLCDWRPGQKQAIIRGVLQRRSCLTRKAAGRANHDQILAANVDTAFIVTSANADFNIRRIERYLTLIWDGGAKPVILITKSELVRDPSALVAETEAAAPGVDVHALSVHTGAGLDQLDRHLAAGKTLVLLGSSGVGKSTLANHVLGHELMTTQSTRSGDDKGRHTTTGRHLFRTPSGTLLIDTPGMRELQLGAIEAGAELAYSDIEEAASRCRFSNCQHGTEPGCAILNALKDGSIESERWESYLKIQREVSFSRRKEDLSEALREKKRWKKVSVQAQAHMKRKRWDG